MALRRRWQRWVLLFLVIPVLGPIVGVKLFWQLRIWLASRTPGLVVKTMLIDGADYRYGVVEPAAGRFSGPRPLVVFLHSASECGHDGTHPAIKISAGFLHQAREVAGALILLPQFPRHDQGWNTEWHELILRLIEQTRKEYAIDGRRIYLVGMSMGGQGCWHLAAERPELFAAVVPICGNGSPEQLAPSLRDVPLWAFHGSSDWIIPVQGSRDLVAAVQAAGGRKVRYTEFAGVGHLCWDAALNDADLQEWLFAQTRAPPAVPTDKD